MKNLLIVVLIAIVAMLGLSRYKPEWVPFLAGERLSRDGREEVQLQLPSSGDARAADADAPAMYRWTDDKGRVTVSDRPPAGRPYETLRFDPDTNLLPAPEVAPPEG